jgi:hypothetical protein
MKRSEINAIMRQAAAFMRRCRFHLPPFAFWRPAEWKRRGAAADGIRSARLGWDITDFGSGDFARCGLFLFTVRNGKKGTGRAYAEKIMVVRERQVTPMHFHFTKTEDIINRGGGDLVLELYAATDDDGLSPGDVTVTTDGLRRMVPAGGRVTLPPGESITIPPRLYHRFWADGSGVLAGEVSLVNDDQTDNRFYEPNGRFPTIEEDEPPLYLLCSDYARYLQ